MKTTRRDFLAAGASAGLTLPFVPRALKASEEDAAPILVVLQLRGGQDALNAVAPMQDPIYVAARGASPLAITSPIQVQASSNLYMHPALAPFKALYDAGKLAIIQGVGYPNANFSHFQSEKIYYQGDPTVLNVSQGWIAGALRTNDRGSSMPAINFEGALNPVFTGYPVPVLTTLNTFQFRTDPQTTLDQVLERTKMAQHAAALRPTPHPNLQYVTSELLDAQAAVTRLQTTGSQYAPAVTYPTNNPLNSVFQLIARYCLYPVGAHIFYTSVGGFDNHANEGGDTGALPNLLARYSSVIKAFLDDLAAQSSDVARRVIVKVWSEFGRRFGPNGSGGTDHGAATINFVAGDRVRGGLYGTYPSFAAITPPYEQRSLTYTTDFRRIDAEIIDYWLNGSSASVFPPGTPTQRLGFIA